MQEKHNIDDLFRNKLSNISEQPSEKVWAKVEQQLRLKKIWKLAALLLLGISTVAIICTVHLLTKETQTSSSNTSLNESNTNTAYNNNNLSQNSHNKEQAHVAINNETVDIEKNIDIKPLKTNKAIAENNSSKTIDLQHNTDSENNRTNNNKTDENKATAPVKISHTTEIPFTQKQKEALFENIKNNETQIAEKIEAAIDAQKQVTETTDKGVETLADKTIEQNHSDSTTETGEKDMAEIMNSEQDADSTFDISAAPPVATQNKPTKPNFEVLFYTQPSYVSKSLKGLSAEDAQFKKQNEKNYLFMNYGMEFRCYISNFFLQTGITQMNSGERNNYDYSYLKNIDTSASHYNVTINSYPDPQNPGNTIIVFDSTWVNLADSTFEEMKLKNLNTLKYLEIPFITGYVFNYEKHQWSVSGGLSFALLSYASMAVINNDTHEVLYINHNDKMLRKNIWSYNLGVAYGYSITGNTRIFLQTCYKKNLNSVFENTSFKQYYNFIDTKIGVMMKF